MNERKIIFCVIPALNEEKTIIQVIQNVKQYVDEIIVVDDGSTDDTSLLAKAGGAIVLRHIINIGQGAALQTGNEYAIQNGANIIVHFDADGQFLANEINDIVKPIIEFNYDIVFGSRFLSKKSNMPWQKKYLILPLARIINKLFFGVNLTDPQSGFRALKKVAAEKIDIRHNDMAHCSEILMKSFENNFKITEVPITVIYYNFGQKFSGGIRIIKDILLGKLIN